MALPTTLLALYCDGSLLSYTDANSVFVKAGCVPGQGWAYYNFTGLDHALSFPTAPRLPFQIFFYGTKITTFGSGIGTFNWSIDGGDSTEATPSSENVPDWPEYFSPMLFNSSILDDTTHILTIENLTGNLTMGPYALVRPGPKSSVKNQYVRVDHTDPSITYKGNWTVGQDIGPARHLSTNEGDSVLFGFCGSFLRVLGTFDATSHGNLTLGFSIDGQSPEIRTFERSTQPYTYNFVPFDIDLSDLAKDSHSSCQHSINVTIQELTGAQSFYFGSFEYKPPFDTLSDAPTITVTPSSSPSSTHASGSSSVSGPHASNEPGGATGSSASGRNRLVGHIVGGVVGGFVLITCIIIALLLMRRRQKARQETEDLSPTPFIYTDRIDKVEFLPYDGYEGLADVGYGTAGRTLAEKDRDRKPPIDAETAQESDTPADIQLANDQCVDLVATDEAPNTLPVAPDTQEENGILSTRVLEMFQSLELRVENALRPPAYDEAI